MTWLQWGHGDEAVEDLSRLVMITRIQTGFNGATAMKPWKTAGSSMMRGSTRLQWGHGDEAVEDGRSCR